ncbi:MAG: thiolase family protein [Desulfuromonadales bacterium]|nr:thiolase family protein [Desulfuromonadales bacterium]
MKDIFVVDALRTPFGSFGGSLSDVPAPGLAAQVISALLDRHGLSGDLIDEVILGQVLQGGSGQAPARQAMRQAGLPDSVHTMTINKVCGSGLKALMLAADAIQLGHSGMVLAGGMENMSLAPYLLPKARFGQRMGNGEVLDLMIHDGLQDPYSDRHMGVITEAWIAMHGISREEQDEFAARSYRLAQTALDSMTFTDELVPVIKQSRKGEVRIDIDEEPFRGDIDKLPSLRPVFGKDGSITAGNASTINDGAGVVLLADAQSIAKHKLQPKARLVASATHSIDPGLFAEAPVGAIRKCAERAGVPLDKIDLFEINEAFAAVPVLAAKQLAIPLEKINVNGGAVALGHPIGASGARLAITAVREMRTRSAQYAMTSLCIGGGEAVAALFERT